MLLIPSSSKVDKELMYYICLLIAIDASIMVMHILYLVHLSTKPHWFCSTIIPAAPGPKLTKTIQSSNSQQKMTPLHLVHNISKLISWPDSIWCIIILTYFPTRSSNTINYYLTLNVIGTKRVHLFNVYVYHVTLDGKFLHEVS